MNFLGFGQSADIEIVFDGAEHKTAEVKGEDGKVEKMLLFYDGETVSGKVRVQSSAVFSLSPEEGTNFFYQHGFRFPFPFLILSFSSVLSLVASPFCAAYLGERDPEEAGQQAGAPGHQD